MTRLQAMFQINEQFWVDFSVLFVNFSYFFDKCLKKLVFGIQFIVIFLKFQEFLEDMYIFEGFVGLNI